MEKGIFNVTFLQHPEKTFLALSTVFSSPLFAALVAFIELENSSQEGQ